MSRALDAVQLAGYLTGKHELQFFGRTYHQHRNYSPGNCGSHGKGLMQLSSAAMTIRLMELRRASRMYKRRTSPNSTSITDVPSSVRLFGHSDVASG